ncbi:MAG: hypothetical protein ACI4Q4_00045 [Oscillospiraceae bacterium]
MKKKVTIILLAAIVLVSGCKDNNNDNTDQAEAPEIPQAETAETASTEESVKNELVGINAGLSGSNSVTCNDPMIGGYCCYIEETDTLYFCSSDVLYQKNGEVVFPLMEGSVRGLNFKNGLLYYIKGNRIESGVFGGIYAYDPVAAKETLLFDGDAVAFFFHGEELYITAYDSYTTNENGMANSVKLGGYILNTVSGELESYTPPEMDERGINILYADDNLWITCRPTQDENTDYLNIGDEVIELIPVREKAFYSDFTVAGNLLICYEDDWTNRGNLASSVRIYDMEKRELTDAVFKSEGYTEDYAYMDGKVYLAGGDIRVYDIETGEYINYFGGYGGKYIECLYACGGKLYGSSYGVFYEIVFDENNKEYKTKYVTKQQGVSS